MVGVCHSLHLLYYLLHRIYYLLHHIYHIHCIISVLLSGLGDLKSFKGAISLVFVVPERLPVVWYSHLPVLAVSS